MYECVHASHEKSELMQTGPLTDLSQEAGMGRHWTMVATVAPRLQAITTKRFP